uniref:Uncharacterized protein n=1 Tax=Panagrolaimus davidi TaxID=227884 RepID=A0A914QZR4_9BILA
MFFNQKKKLFKHTPPHTPTTLSADTAENLFKRRAERTASGASTHQRHSASFVEEGISVSPLASGASAIISPSGVTVTSPGRITSHSIMSIHHPPISPKTSSNPFQAPKSKFKMAHESFRIRMFQEQYGFEPVFMTKKRTADSKASEFKGGDLNKYTSRSYTIKNGNEIFGAK